MSTENCENYAIINGKKYLISDNEVGKCLSFLKPASPFDMVSGKKYWYIDWGGELAEAETIEDSTDELLSAVANYCTNRELMQQRAYMETLNRLLWRYSMEHEGNRIGLKDDATEKYYIFFDSKINEWHVGILFTTIVFGSILFYSREIAKDAIEEIIFPFMEIHPDFDPMAIYNVNH